MKKWICLLMAALLLSAAAACHKTQPTAPSPAYTTQPAPQPAPAETQDSQTPAETDTPAPATPNASEAEPAAERQDSQSPAETDTPAPATPNASEAEPAAERQDGERFETSIMVEGMEETVSYEHIRNDTIGFEMDYDYELFVRHSDPVCDRFVSIYDDPEDPQNYLEVQYSGSDADTIAASVIETLSDDYEIIREQYTLDRAGSCIRIDASEVKGGGYTADQMQMVYIIPTDDGCRIAAAHYSAEGSEGFGRRFSYMMNTFRVIGRNDEFTDAADFGEPTPPAAPADTPAATPAYASASVPKITKSPTGETVDVGGSAMFVARSDDATRSEWHLVNPDLSQDLDYIEAAREFDSLDIIDGDTDSLVLMNIPESLNGWSVYCHFSNAAGSADTDRAAITVNAVQPPEQAAFDYTGTYTEALAQRGTMEITGSPSLYDVSVDWYEGSTEYITNFSGTFSDTGIMSYSDAVLTVRFEDGSHELRYTGGTGSLAYVDSGVVGVYWTDDQSEYDEDNFFFAKD